MTLAVITATVLATQAATFNWQLQAIPYSGVGFVPQSTLSAYFFAVDENFGDGGFDRLFNPATGTLIGGGSGNGAISGGPNYFSDGSTYSSLSLSYTAPDGFISGWYALVIFDSNTPNYCGIELAWIPAITVGDGAYNATTGGASPTIRIQYQIIPEPATAMLALAGIGLLIAQKRKRA